MLIKRADNYREIYDSFRWQVPAHFNMAVACCDRWAADPARVALIHEQPDGSVRRYTFAELKGLSHRCANMYVGLGLQRGDRVLLLLGQRPETAVLHLAAWRAGMVSVVCSVLFGADAIAYRVQNCGAKIVFTDSAYLEKAALEQEVREFVKTRLARHEYPRTIEFVDSLPTTTTGKIKRRELRERELDRIRETPPT